MTLAEATRIYQANLEAHRIDPDDEVVYKELLNAKIDMETLWLENSFKK